MYVTNDAQLGGLWDKITKAAHKINKMLPRELSPTRMVKHSTKQKVKVKQLQTAVSEANRAAMNAIAEGETAKQVAAITASTPINQGATNPAPVLPIVDSAAFAPPVNTAQPLTFNDPSQVPASVAAMSQPEGMSTAMMVGIGVAALAGIYLLTRKR